MKNKIRQLSLLLIPALAAISLIIVCACHSQLPNGYQMIWLMPIVYTIFVLCFNKQIFNTDYTLAMGLYFGTQLLRMVVMPAVLALAGQSLTGGLVVLSSDLQKAVLMIVFEFLLVGMVVVILSRRRIHNKRENMPVLAGAPIVYIVMGILAVAIYIYFKAKDIDLVYFFTIPVGAEERIGDLTDTFLVLARRIVTVAINFMFVYITDRCYRKETLRPQKRNVNIAIVAAILSVCIIVGERRSAQIYTAFCSCYILILVFREKSGKILRWVCGAALVVFALMSVYKQFAGFLYDSYGEAISNASMSISEFATLLQSYFAGPKNIAIAMNFGDNSNLGLKQVVFDFARSTFPLSLFIKGSGSLTSVLMNRYIYHGLQDSGHVLAATGYGYIFGGVTLFFWPALLNVACAFFAEKRMRKAKSYEGIQIWLYILLRFGLNLSANTPALVSAATIRLGTAGLVLIAAIIVKRMLNNENTGYILRNQ